MTLVVSAWWKIWGLIRHCLHKLSSRTYVPCLQFFNRLWHLCAGQNNDFSQPSTGSAGGCGNGDRPYHLMLKRRLSFSQKRRADGSPWRPTNLCKKSFDHSMINTKHNGAAASQRSSNGAWRYKKMRHRLKNKWENFTFTPLYETKRVPLLHLHDWYLRIIWLCCCSSRGKTLVVVVVDLWWFFKTSTNHAGICIRVSFFRERHIVCEHAIFSHEIKR